MCHQHEDNEAVVKMIMQGTSASKRHVSGTHREDPERLLERVTWDPAISSRCVNTTQRIADVLTRVHLLLRRDATGSPHTNTTWSCSRPQHFSASLPQPRKLLFSRLLSPMLSKQNFRWSYVSSSTRLQEDKSQHEALSQSDAGSNPSPVLPRNMTRRAIPLPKRVGECPVRTNENLRSRD